MPTIGKINRLLVVEKVADGIYLDGAELDAIFLPYGDVSREIKEGDKLDVFLYLDSKDVVIATAGKPNAVVGDCALLKVISVGKFGAFLDWGIGKDLLLPHSEQAFPIEEGREYLVYVFQDERTGRVAATTKFHFHFEESSGPYRIGEQVDLLIVAKTELGYKAIFNDEYLGLIHAGDLNQPLAFGERIKGWIKSVRDDGKVDLSINTLDNETRDELEQLLLDQLNESEDGTLAFSDKSPAEAIYSAFKVSKKNFKRAVSGLYKKRLILIEPNLIRLSGNTTPFIEKRKPRPRTEPQLKEQKSSRDSSDKPYSDTSNPYGKRPASQSPFGKKQSNRDPDDGSRQSRSKVSARDTEAFKSRLKSTRKVGETESRKASDPYAKTYNKSAEASGSKKSPVSNSPYKKEENKKTPYDKPLRSEPSGSAKKPKPEHANAHIYNKGKNS